MSESKLLIALFEGIKDVVDVAGLTEYVHELEAELVRVRGSNEKYIQIINNSKNKRRVI